VKGRSIAGCVFVLAAFFTCTASARAGVGFLPATPLAVKWSELQKGRRIEACNGTSRTLRRIAIKTAGFNFTEANKQVPESDSVVGAHMLVKRIPPGSCRQLQVETVKGKNPDPGEYHGSLVLVAPGAGLTRLNIALTVPGEQPAQPTPVSEGGDSFTVHSVTPGTGSGTSTLLLEPAKEGEAALPLGRECGDRILPDHEHCQTLGNLYQGSHIVAVKVRGEAVEDQRKGVRELPVELDYLGGHPVGAYEGTLNLSEGGISHPVKLKVDFKDAWYCAVIALLVGASIAVLLKLYEGRWRPKHALNARVDHLKAAYLAIKDNPKQNIEVDYANYLSGIRAAIKRYANSVALLDTRAEAYVEIDKALQLAEADPRLLQAEDGLAASLKLLDGEQKKTIAMLKQYKVSDVPAILSLAAEALAGGTIAVGEVVQREERANELVGLLQRWRGLTHRLMFHAVWLKRTAARKNGIDAEDKRSLTLAGTELFGVRQALFEEVLDAKSLARIRRSTKLDEAIATITSVAIAHGVRRPGPNDGPTEDGKLASFGYPALDGEAIGQDLVEKNPATVTSSKAMPVRLPPKHVGLLIGDVLSLIVTLAISIIAGLSAFYFGKPFGSLESYLEAIFATLAVQTIAQQVLQQLSVFAHDISPEVRTKAPVVESIVPKMARAKTP
jgi:hypothetical protein